MSDNSVKTCHNCKYGTFDALWGIIICIRPAMCKQRDLWEVNVERKEEADYISRKDAIEAITANSRDSDSKYLESERIILESDAIEALTILPSVKPETAKMVVGKGSTTLWYECSECGEPVDVKDNYCRRCGRRFMHDLEETADD